MNVLALTLSQCAAARCLCSVSSHVKDLSAAPVCGTRAVLGRALTLAPPCADILSTGGSASGVPGEAPPTRNPLYMSGDRLTQGAVAAHAVSPSISPRTHSGATSVSHISPLAPNSGLEVIICVAFSGLTPQHSKSLSFLEASEPYSSIWLSLLTPGLAQLPAAVCKQPGHV